MFLGESGNKQSPLKSVIHRPRGNIGSGRNAGLDAATGEYDDIYLMPKMIASTGKVAYHGLSKYHFDRHESNNSVWTQNHHLLDVETLKEYLKEWMNRYII